MEKLNKAIEKYKLDCVSDYYEINSVSEYMEHICAYQSDNYKTGNFEQCLKEHINELENYLKSDNVAYVCTGNNDVYPRNRVLEIGEEDQECDKDQDIKIFTDIREFFKGRVKNNLMNDYTDYQLFEYVKNEVEEREPFAYDVYTESLIKGE